MKDTEIHGQIKKLLVSKAQKNFQVVETNFQIGRILSGADDVQTIARELASGGTVVKETCSIHLSYGRARATTPQCTRRYRPEQPACAGHQTASSCK